MGYTLSEVLEEAWDHCAATDCAVQFRHQRHRFPADSKNGRETLSYEFDLNDFWDTEGSTTQDLVDNLSDDTRARLTELARDYVKMAADWELKAVVPPWTDDWQVPGPYDVQPAPEPFEAVSAIDGALSNPEHDWSTPDWLTDPQGRDWLNRFRAVGPRARTVFAVWAQTHRNGSLTLASADDYRYAASCL